MKKRFAVLITILFAFLSGCSGGNDELDRAMALRSRLVSCNGCTFDAEVTADYEDKLYSFSMNCRADSAGNVAFTVTAPDSIAGITGTVSQQGGTLTFDDTALAFELLADGLFSPVSAPWILIHTLQSGYLTSCAELDDGLLLSVDNSYEEDSLNLSIRLGSGDLPTEAEISWQGRRILSLTVKNFAFQ